MNLINRDDALAVAKYSKDPVEGIKHLPAVDAVPVVRCGECVEYRNGDCYHPLAYGMGSMLRGLEPTDFCSFGERKENG